MIVKCEDYIREISTEELTAELNRRKDVEVDKQIECIRKAVRTLNMLDIRVENDCCSTFTDVDYENGMLIFQFEG